MTFFIILVGLTFLVYLWTNILIALYHYIGQTDATPLSYSPPLKPQSSGWRPVLSGAMSHISSSPSLNKDNAEYDHLNGDLEDMRMEVGMRERRERGSSESVTFSAAKQEELD